MNRFLTNKMKFLYKTSIDIVNPHYLSGWCFARFNKDRRVELELFCGNQKIGETIADMFREDLRELGIHPDGRCGFEFALGKEGDRCPGKPLVIRPKGSAAVLGEVGPDGSIIRKSNRFLKLASRIGSTSKAEQETILFMHVPKTAGTSFNTLVRSLLPKEGIIAHIELKDNREYARLQRDYRYISGHLRVGLFKAHFDLQQAHLYAIVREPYSHLHSHLKWLIKTSTASDDNYFKYSNPVIYELGRELSRFDLGDTGVLSRFVENIKGASAAFFDNMQVRYFLDHEPDRVTGDDLAIAVRNTGLFKAIGLTEKYDDFVQNFKRINHLNRPILQEKLNRSTSPPLFDFNDENLRKILYPLVRYDLDLYDRIEKSSVSSSAGRKSRE